MDARTPLAHKTSHEEGGADELDHDELKGAKGFKTHTQIDADLLTLTNSTVDLTNRMNQLETQLDIISQAAGGNMEVNTAEDSVDPDIVYIGEAVPGSVNSDPVWKITQFVEDNNGSTFQQFANGDSGYVHVWDDRESLTYT